MRSSSTLSTRVHHRADRLDGRLDLPFARFAAHRAERLDQVRMQAVDLLAEQRRQLARHPLARRIGHRARGLLARRIELGLEQLDQQARVQGVLAQGLLHVGLRERHPGLQQVLAAGAQHRDLAPVEAGGEDQVVEAVVLGIAAPDALEGLLERVLERVEVEIAAPLGHHLEVLDVDVAAATAPSRTDARTGCAGPCSPSSAARPRAGCASRSGTA